MTRWTSPSLLAGAFLVILTVPTALLISIPGQTGARMVIAEYFSHSQCPDCHAANVRLSGIYDDDDRDFVYVALITDKNRQAKGRFVDYVPIPEEQRYPTVEFDGGYREEEGKRTTDVYRGDIDDCAAREVPGVDLDVSMDQRGADSFRLHVRARLMDGDSIHVRVLAYVVENVSRYRDADGRSYRFGLLDIAIDANITLGGDWWSNDTLWVGSDHRDSRGDDFGDAEYANLNVIVGVFLNETGQPRRAVRAAMAVPPVLTILSDGGNVTGQFEIRARVEGDRVRGTTISTVEYRVDDAPWTTMISTGGGAYSAVWNSTDVDNGTHVIIVRAVDGTGTSSRATITVNVSNDDFEPPTLRFVEPPPGTHLNGTIDVILHASDDRQLNVSLYLGGPDPIWLTSANATFTYDWDTTSSPEGPITVVAVGTDGAFTVTRDRTFVVDNDATPVFISGTPPDGALVRSSIDIIAVFADDGPFLNMTLLVDGAKVPPLTAPSERLNDTYATTASFVLDTTAFPEGSVNLSVMALDGAGQRAWWNISVDIDNTPPPPVEIRAEWEARWNISWTPASTDTASYRIHLADEALGDLEGHAWTVETSGTTWAVPDDVVPCHAAVVPVDRAGNAGVPVWVFLGRPPRLDVGFPSGEFSLVRGSTANLTVAVTNDGDVDATNVSLFVTLDTDIVLHNGTILVVPAHSTVNITVMFSPTHGGLIIATATLYDTSVHDSIGLQIREEEMNDPMGGITAVLLLVILAGLSLFLARYLRGPGTR